MGNMKQMIESPESAPSQVTYRGRPEPRITRQCAERDVIGAVVTYEHTEFIPASPNGTINLMPQPGFTGAITEVRLVDRWPEGIPDAPA